MIREAVNQKRSIKMAKNKFDDLDEEFKDAVAAMTEAQLRLKICEISLNQMEIEAAKKNDEDLKAAVEAAKTAGASYKEATKMNKLRAKFCRRVLADQGKITTEFSEESS